MTICVGTSSLPSCWSVDASPTSMSQLRRRPAVAACCTAGRSEVDDAAAVDDRSPSLTCPFVTTMHPSAPLETTRGIGSTNGDAGDRSSEATAMSGSGAIGHEGVRGDFFHFF